MRYIKIFTITLVLTFSAIAAMTWLYLSDNPRKMIRRPEKISSSAKLKIVFERPVNRKTLNVTLDPPISGTLTFEKPLIENHLFREAVFSPIANWSPGELYMVTLTGLQGVVTRKYGRKVQFQVEVQGEHQIAVLPDFEKRPGLPKIYGKTEKKIELPVEIDYQDKSLSCEAAVLKMALSYYEINVEENDIMKIVGFDPTPHIGDTWGDPYKAYVGNIDGKQNTTGYGVYWEPIAKAARLWKPGSYSFTNWTLEQILYEVSIGHPVLMWGIYPGGTPDQWLTPDGKKIHAWKGEHTRVITGFTGTPKIPEKIIALDPVAGKQFWSPEDLVENWSAFDMSGVVVR
jgi:uncharacterized protein YvpB